MVLTVVFELDDAVVKNAREEAVETNCLVLLRLALLTDNNTALLRLLLVVVDSLLNIVLYFFVFDFFVLV